MPAASNRRRVAILGAGMIGLVHRRAAVLAGADIVGVMASSPDRSRQVAREWGVPQGYADLDEVIASDAEIVHICTPNASHVPYAVRLMEAGKHVLCEKPLGVSLAEADEAAAVAARTGVVNTVPFVYRYHPMARELRARVQSDDFGAVNLVHGSYLQDWMLDPMTTSWRVDPETGGPSRAFADIGSHWCDLAEWVMGDRIERLVSTTSISVPQRPVQSSASFSVGTFSGSGANPGEAEMVEVRTEDSAVITFRTAADVAGSAVISQLSAGRKNRLWLEVDGLHHSAVFDQEQSEQLWVGAESGAQVLVRDPNHGSAEQRRLAMLPAGHAQGYAQCFEAYVADSYAAVDAHEDRGEGRGEVPDGLPTFADGARAAAICDAVLRSVRESAWVTITE